MEWKEMSENGKEHPCKIVEREIQGFSIASKELVELKLFQNNGYLLESSTFNRDFEFTLDLSSKYVKGYCLEIFKFGYNVDLEKVKIIIEESIYKEVSKMFLSPKPYVILRNNEDFVKFLNIIFRSNRFMSIMTGLMKIAVTNKNDGKTKQ